MYNVEARRQMPHANHNYIRQIYMIKENYNFNITKYAVEKGMEKYVRQTFVQFNEHCKGKVTNKQV